MMQAGLLAQSPSPPRPPTPRRSYLLARQEAVVGALARAQAEDVEAAEHSAPRRRASPALLAPPPASAAAVGRRSRQPPPPLRAVPGSPGLSAGGSSSGAEDLSCAESTQYFAMDDDSDNEGCEHNGLELYESLEDMYSFDPGKVSALLRRGANFRELRDAIQEALTAALEQRLAAACEPEPPAVAAAPASPNAPSVLTGDLAGRMTPGCATPPSGEAEEVQTDGQLLLRAATTVEEARKASKARCSSRAQARLCHRMSLCKAQELTATALADSCGSGGEAPPPEGSVDLVQRAIEEAAHRHRRSITGALRQLAGSESGDADSLGAAAVATESSERSDDSFSKVLQDRIQQAMAAAYERQRKREAGTDAHHHPQRPPAWPTVLGWPGHPVFGYAVPVPVVRVLRPAVGFQRPVSVPSVSVLSEGQPWQAPPWEPKPVGPGPQCLATEPGKAGRKPAMRAPRRIGGA